MSADVQEITVQVTLTYRFVDPEKAAQRINFGISIENGGWVEQPLQRLDNFVREPFPSVYTGAELNFGFLESGSQLVIHSEMGTGGVIFADGIEGDNIEFLDGHTVSVGVAHDALNLLVPAS